MQAAWIPAFQTHDMNDYLAYSKQELYTHSCSYKQRRLQCLKNGIPQGLVLASLLYNIYTYDLPSLVSKKYNYTDDLVLLHSSNNWKSLDGV